MTVHIAKLGLVTVNSLGVVKPKTSMTTKEVCNSSSEIRVLPDTDYASTVGYPTLKAYLTAEAGLGFKLYHLDQYTVITYDV